MDLDIYSHKKKELFNFKHSKIRSLIERTIGRLKGRFRVFKNDISLELITPAICCCALLHNLIEDDDDIVNLDPVEEENSEEDPDMEMRLTPNIVRMKKQERIGETSLLTKCGIEEEQKMRIIE